MPRGILKQEVTRICKNTKCNKYFSTIITPQLYCSSSCFQICRKERQKKLLHDYYQNHKKELDERNKKWSENHKKELSLFLRNNVLNINGKKVRVNKKPFQGICELCGNPVENIPMWHHWDDNHPELGMWVCWRCHFQVAELYEQYWKNQDEILKYIALKKEIELGVIKQLDARGTFN